MSDKIFDYIIYSASIPGVIYSIVKSMNSKSVLLLNNYGFPGGSITENLNCHQDIDVKKLGRLTQEFYDSIISGNDKPLYQKDNYAIINPEAVKINLQQKLEQNEIDLLFHVTAEKIIFDNDGIINVTLLGKEGEIIVKGKKCLDASDDYSVVNLLNGNRSVNVRFINLFITPPSDNKFLSFDRIKKAIPLRDGRYWISLSIEIEDETFVENESHEVLELFRNELEKSNSRIQILPLKSYTSYRIDPGLKI